MQISIDANIRISLSYGLESRCEMLCWYFRIPTTSNTTSTTCSYETSSLPRNFSTSKWASEAESDRDLYRRTKCSLRRVRWSGTAAEEDLATRRPHRVDTPAVARRTTIHHLVEKSERKKLEEAEETIPSRIPRAKTSSSSNSSTKKSSSASETHLTEDASTSRVGNGSC